MGIWILSFFMFIHDLFIRIDFGIEQNIFRLFFWFLEDDLLELDDMMSKPLQPSSKSENIFAKASTFLDKFVRKYFRF